MDTTVVALTTEEYRCYSRYLAVQSPLDDMNPADLAVAKQAKAKLMGKGDCQIVIQDEPISIAQLAGQALSESHIALEAAVAA